MFLFRFNCRVWLRIRALLGLRRCVNQLWPWWWELWTTLIPSCAVLLERPWGGWLRWSERQPSLPEWRRPVLISEHIMSPISVSLLFVSNIMVSNHLCCSHRIFKKGLKKISSYFTPVFTFIDWLICLIHEDEFDSIWRSKVKPKELTFGHNSRIHTPIKTIQVSNRIKMMNW